MASEGAFGPTSLSAITSQGNSSRFRLRDRCVVVRILQLLRARAIQAVSREEPVGQLLVGREDLHRAELRREIGTCLANFW